VPQPDNPAKHNNLDPPVKAPPYFKAGHDNLFAPFRARAAGPPPIKAPPGFKPGGSPVAVAKVVKAASRRAPPLDLRRPIPLRLFNAPPQRWHVISSSAAGINMTAPKAWAPHTTTRRPLDTSPGGGIRSDAGVIFTTIGGEQPPGVSYSRSIDTPAGCTILPAYEDYGPGGHLPRPSMILVAGTPTASAMTTTPDDLSESDDDPDLPPSPSPVAGERRAASEM